MMVLINGWCATIYRLCTISARAKTTKKWRRVLSRVGNVRYPLVMLIMLCDGFSFFLESQQPRSIFRLLRTVMSSVEVEQDLHLLKLLPLHS